MFAINGRAAKWCRRDGPRDSRRRALRNDCGSDGSTRGLDDLEKPVIALNGQPADEQVSTLLWDGEWEVTWVTFRDMGAAFGVALLGIYILVVAQFGSFKAPLVILTPVPLTFIGILAGHWLFGRAVPRPTLISAPCRSPASIVPHLRILLVAFIRQMPASCRATPLTPVLNRQYTDGGSHNGLQSPPIIRDEGSRE